MTALDTRELLSTDLGALPRVNLLPPEIAESRRLRQIQVGLGGTLLASVAVVAALAMAASSSVSSSRAESEAATAQGSALQSQVAKLSPVTGVYAQSAAAQALLTQAMGEEVRYSTLLSNLSLSVPAKVWVKSLTFTQAPQAAGPAATPGIGTMSVTGVGFSHDDVAVWLESLAGQKAIANPYFSNSTETLLGTRKVVNFTSTATLSTGAYSGEYTKPAGG